MNLLFSRLQNVRNCQEKLHSFISSHHWQHYKLNLKWDQIGLCISYCTWLRYLVVRAIDPNIQCELEYRIMGWDGLLWLWHSWSAISHLILSRCLRICHRLIAKVAIAFRWGNYLSRWCANAAHSFYYTLAHRFDVWWHWRVRSVEMNQSWVLSTRNWAYHQWG